MFKFSIAQIKKNKLNLRTFTSGADVIHKVLLQNNIQNVFGFSGGAILPVLDKFHDSSINFIMNRTEQCSGHAATGYSKSTGELGVIVTTSGPGVTNLITPLHDAFTDGVPILALTGQVPTNAIGTDAFQECPAIELTKACTKWNYQLTANDNIEDVMKYAIYVANDNRKGPVHIDLPKDIMTLEYNKKITNDKFIIKKKYNNYKSNQDTNIKKFIKLLNKSKRPVIIAGNGTLNCSKELRKFVNKNKIPITTTIHGMGVYDEREDMSLHMLGMHGSVYANYAVQNADLIIGLGCRFDDRITGNLKGYAINAFKHGGVIHIDNNINQIDKVKNIVNPNLSIKYDSKDFLINMNSNIQVTHNIDRSEWLNQIKEWKQTFPFFYTPSNKGTPKTQEVIKKLYNYVNTKKLNDQMIITTGVGNHQMMAAQFYRWTHPRSILTSGSAGVMGAGLPFAIGAQIANPDKTVVLIDGDSSFNMTFNDLGLVAEKKLPLKIIIMNDGRQQMVHIWQKLFFNNRFVGTNNYNPDYVKLGDAFGIDSILCDRVDDIESSIELLMENKNPMILEFKIEPDICLPLVAPGKNLDEMITDYSKVLPMEGIAPS